MLISIRQLCIVANFQCASTKGSLLFPEPDCRTLCEFSLSVLIIIFYLLGESGDSESSAVIKLIASSCAI